MRVKIELETLSDAIKLASIANKFTKERITITDGNGLCANAKSILGSASAIEYEELWLESEKDHYTDFKDFIV